MYNSRSAQSETLNIQYAGKCTQFGIRIVRYIKNIYEKYVTNIYNIQQSFRRNLWRQKHELTYSASGDKQRDEAQKTLKRRLTIKKVIKVAGYRAANKVFFQEKVDQWQLDV